MVPETSGVWWYWWGTDENGNPLSCAPDNDNQDFCDDEMSGSVGREPGGRDRAYLQQDANNTWQAENVFPGGPVKIDWIDWGDNIESVPWYLNSMVRVEVVLLNDLPGWMRSYQMTHLYGWGIDEMWGIFSPQGGRPEDIPLSQTTVYTNCARLTIQKLADGCDPATLVWNETEWTGTCVEEPIFSKSVRDTGDGPGYYAAEINVKGKIVYGYTWGVRDNNAGAGKYRLTFSLDNEGICPELNTSFSAGEGTQIYLPVETEETLVVTEESGSAPSGGTAVILTDQSVSYIDVDILPVRGKGGKKPVAKTPTKKVIIKKGGKR